MKDRFDLPLLIAELLAAGCGEGKAGNADHGLNAELHLQVVGENNQIVGFDVDRASLRNG